MNIAYNVDCMEYMRTLQDKAFDLAVVDPPYFSGPERRGYYGREVSPIGVRRDYPVSPKWEIPKAPSAIVRLPRRTATTAFDCSAICGMGCCRGKASQRAQ